VFLTLQQLLAPFGITKCYTDGWGAYERHLSAEQPQVGKKHTQKIERKHIHLRTRIKRLLRRTLCFSKTEHMHALVIGLFIHRYAFGQLLCFGINTCETSSRCSPVIPPTMNWGPTLVTNGGGSSLSIDLPGGLSTWGIGCISNR